MAPRKKNDSQSKRGPVNPNAVIENAGVMVEQPITETLEKNYMPYAMSVIVSRAIPGDRRLQAFSPQAALYHVQDGAAHRGPDQVRQCGGSDHAAQPPRRCRHL